MAEEVAFGTQSYRLDSRPVSSQRLINGYAEIQPPDAKSPMPIFGSPGIDTFATIGAGPIRALFEMNGVGYAISRDEMYSFDENGVSTLLGSGMLGLGPLPIDGNGFQVATVDGTGSYVWTVATATFSQVSDVDFNSANTIAFINSYFAYDWAGTNKWFLSDLIDGTSFNGLMFASAEAKPDRVMAVRNHNGLLLIFGEKTIEPWNDSGASSFPFQLVTGSVIDRGLLAALAHTSEDNGVFFLGNDRVFYRKDGDRPQRISTHAIEKHWETLQTVSDAFCFSVSFGGHKWIYVTFPTEGETWGCDIANNYRWHERQSYDSGGNEVRWRANCACQIFGKQFVGDANSGKIGTLSSTVYTEFGDPIITTMTSAPLHGGGKRVFMPMFEADMETGVGLTTGQGSDPQAMLDWSDNGGRSWTSPQTFQSMGQIGAYNTRLRWPQLGSFYERTLRLTISDPVKKVLIAARAPGINTGVG